MCKVWYMEGNMGVIYGFYGGSKLFVFYMYFAICFFHHLAKLRLPWACTKMISHFATYPCRFVVLNVKHLRSCKSLWDSRRSWRGSLAAYLATRRPDWSESLLHSMPLRACTWNIKLTTRRRGRSWTWSLGLARTMVAKQSVCNLG